MTRHVMRLPDLGEGTVSAEVIAWKVKPGDVVTQVDGAAASSPLVVVRLLGLNEQARASLRVMRARSPRVVQFRWGR